MEVRGIGEFRTRRTEVIATLGHILSLQVLDADVVVIPMTCHLVVEGEIVWL